MFHNIDENSKEFYDIAFEYAICPNYNYILETLPNCNIDLNTFRALTKDSSFTSLVEEIKKGFGDEDPFTIKLKSSRLSVLNENIRIAKSKEKMDEKHKMKAIDLIFTMSEDKPKNKKVEDTKKNNPGVNIMIGMEDYDDDNGEE